VDSIFFNLYTDSLKKGTYNYINVDGRYSNGNFLPLTANDLNFTSSAGKFTRNSLFIDNSFAGEKVTVRVVYVKNPALQKEIVIYIKKYESTEKLKTLDEAMKTLNKEPTKAKRKKNKS